jgi:hypothetical protein
MNMCFYKAVNQVMNENAVASTDGNVKGQDERFAPLTLPSVPAFWSIGDD